MSEIYLSKAEKKTLKRMRGLSSVPEAEIYNCRYLYQLDLIDRNYSGKHDPFGNFIHDGTYHLTDKYERYIEARRERFLFWFVPVAISAAALLISLAALLK